jgi:S1-C subfamily serine protease
VSLATPNVARRLARRGAFLALCAAAAALVGCGGSGDSSEPAATAPSAAPEPAAKPPRVIVQTADSGFDAARVYRKASPGVVTIKSVFSDSSALLGDGVKAAEGSGFVISKKGEIVTNAHVVTNGTGSERVDAKNVYVVFPDLNTVAAKIVGTDPFSDVALLKVDPDGLRLRPLELGDDKDLVTGQPVAVIGDPFFEEQSLSTGVVSGLDRSVESLTEFEIQGAIQTDAAINPGNSGGPMLDAAARVVGIGEQIRSRSGSNAGVGFAVPISAAKRSIAQLRKTGEVKYAYIGVSSQALYPQLADRLGLDTDFGGLVAEVVPNGPADDAGLQGGDHKIQFQVARVTTGGDVILSVDGHRLVRPDDLASLIAAHAPGEQVTLEILRDGERKQVEVTLGVRPTSIPNG